MIDYTVEPKKISNAAYISYSYFEMLYDLLDYSIPIQPETIIALSILSEAIVLHEELVPDNHKLATISEDEHNFIAQFAESGALWYDAYSEIFIPREDSAALLLDNEVQEYLTLNNITLSDIGLQTEHIRHFDEGAIEESLSVYQIGYSEESLENSANLALFKEKIALDHGMPIIDGIYHADWGRHFYSFDFFQQHVNYSIPHDLLKQIDAERFGYIDELTKKLGNTYVGLPSIISIVLDRSNDIVDIPESILSLRDEMREFRNKCTTFEYALRRESNFMKQCEIIDEIKNAHESSSGMFSKKKRRILQNGIEILTEIEPTSMASSLSKKLHDAYNQHSLRMKLPGYYDLYRKSFDVEDNLRTLKRLFGSSINDEFVQRLRLLAKA